MTEGAGNGAGPGVSSSQRPLIVLFAVGVALGMALRDDPEPGGTVTLVRTLEPRPQETATTP